MEVKMTVDAGVCRFKTEISASTDDEGNVLLDIKSECPAINKLGENLKQISIFEAIETPINTNPIYVISGEYVKHAACPVPCAIVKVSEAASELALKKDVTMKYE